MKWSRGVGLLLSCVALTACSGGGGGGGGGGSLSAFASVASYAPTSVARASSYSYAQAYQPGTGGSVVALAVAPASSSAFAAVSGTSRIDRIDTGYMTEVALPADPSSFAASSADLFVATSQPGGTGQVFRRDSISGTWGLEYSAPEPRCVVASFMGSVVALHGDDGVNGTVTRSGASWTDIAYLTSCVPAAGVELNGELWVGGRNAFSKEPKLLHGATTFADRPVPLLLDQGQRASVTVLGSLGSAVFAGVRIEDAKTGAVQGGVVFYVGKTDNDMVSLLSLQQEAPTCFGLADGTLYVGTTAGKVYWLDSSGRFQQDSGLPSSLGVTALVDFGGQLLVALDEPTGPLVVTRSVVVIQQPQPAPMPMPAPLPSPPGNNPPPPSPPAPSPPPGSSSAMTFRDVTPNTGFVTGYFEITITGSDFKNLTAVNVGGKPVMNLQFAPTEIRARVPAGVQAGAVAIQLVSSTEGTLNVPNALTYTQTSATAPSYQTSVLPIVQNRCNSCHLAAGRASLSPYATMMPVTVGGTPLVSPGDVNTNSYILQKIDQAIGGNTASMSGYLQAAERQTIEQWIAGGAKP